MPACVVCGDRPFGTKEALLQHLRTSSLTHPFCLPCDRRFASDSAYNAHMKDKHPPTYDCRRCARQYTSAHALEDHFRGHNAHPNCAVCGKGFFDIATLNIHMQENHVSARCAACNLQFESANLVNEHYKQSPAHPKCPMCEMGFPDARALEKHNLESSHVLTSSMSDNISELPGRNPRDDKTPTMDSQAHLQVVSVPQTTSTSSPFTGTSELGGPLAFQSMVNQTVISSPPLFVNGAPQLTQTHSTSSYAGTGFSPLSPKLNPFNKELRRVAAIDTIPRIDSPDLSQIIHPQNSPLLKVQTPIFSPITLPKPNKQIDEIWSSRQNVQISQTQIFQDQNSVSRHMNTLETHAQPKPWNASSARPMPVDTAALQQMIPYTNYRHQFAVPPRHRSASDLGSGNTPVPKTSPTVSSFTRQPTSQVAEGRLNTRTEFNFNPRLYPGSARATASQSQSDLHASRSTAFYTTNNHNGGRKSNYTSPRSSVSPLSPPNSTFPKPSDLRPRQPASLLSLPLPPLPTSPPSQQKSSLSAPSLQPFHNDNSGSHWENLVLEELEYTPTEEIHKMHTYQSKDDLSVFSEVSTPRLIADVPLHDYGVKPETGESPGTGKGLLPSPSEFSSVSSVTSSVPRTLSPTPTRKSVRSRPVSRATSVARSDISLNIPIYRVTPSSERDSSVSPDVFSPVGLAALPSISPFINTPIDMNNSFDIPEARKPLPESTPSSPASLRSSTSELEEAAPQSADGLSNCADKSEPSERSVLLAFEKTDPGRSLTNSHRDVPEAESPSTPNGSTQRQPTPEQKADINGEHNHPEHYSSIELSVEPDKSADITVQSPSPAPASALEDDKSIDIIEDIPSSEPLATQHLQTPESQQKQRLVAPSLGLTPNTSIASTAPSEAASWQSSKLSLLHCRVCRADPADDITATICGHVFCHRCITDALIKSSRCPFCSTPALLYCMFRLDLTT